MRALTLLICLDNSQTNFEVRERISNFVVVDTYNGGEFQGLLKLGAQNIQTYKQWKDVISVIFGVQLMTQIEWLYSFLRLK